MCDVDHFKLYNDTYGHIAGDEVLRKIARALSNGCRGADHAYRYGGEEFLLILASPSAASAQRSAERHRLAVEALDIPHSASPSGRVTISVGVSILSQDVCGSTDKWLTAADHALYEAKRLGRNRVIANPESVAVLSQI